MSPRSDVFQTIPFDATSDVTEPLIAAGDAEEEDYRLQETALSRFKFSSLLLGLLFGFSSQFSTLGVKYLVSTISGEYVVTTDVFVNILVCCFCFLVIVFVILRFLRHLVAITYSAIGGRSKDLLEEIVLHMNCGFVMGTLVGINLFWTMEAVLCCVRAHIMPMYTLVTLLMGAFLWRKIMIMYLTTNIERHRLADR
jgi:hypothetical protein